MRTQSSIYDGLDQSEMRRGLASLFRQVRKSGGHAATADVLAELRKRRDELTRQIELCEQACALEMLFKLQGWDWFDHSAEIVDYSDETFTYFIGTPEEFERQFGYRPE